MYRIQWTKYSKDDYEKLDGSQKVFVDKALDRIKLAGMNSGKRLGGDLVGCNRLKNNRLGLRVVFREVENKIEVIQIVVIGKRSDSEVYKMVAKRMD